MQSFSFSKTARIVILYLALIYGAAVLFTSCSSPRATMGCGNENGFIGYGNHAHAVKGPKRISY